MTSLLDEDPPVNSFQLAWHGYLDLEKQVELNEVYALDTVHEFRKDFEGELNIFKGSFKSSVFCVVLQGGGGGRRKRGGCHPHKSFPWIFPRRIIT